MPPTPRPQNKCQFCKGTGKIGRRKCQPCFGDGVEIIINPPEYKTPEFFSNGHWASLSEIREATWEGAKRGGCFCPACNKFTKVYSRPINESMARAFIWVVRMFNEHNGWIDVKNEAPRWVVRTNQHTILRWWRLVERKPLEESDGDIKHSGFWKPTELGLRWFNNETKITSRVITYNDEVITFHGPAVSLIDCFDEHFSYHDAMKAVLV